MYISKNHSKMLQNEYLVAKIGVDPAENESSKLSLSFVLEAGAGLPVAWG